MSCDLTLDPNTAHRNLSLSEGNRRVERVKEEQPYPDHPERFDLVPQVLCREGLTGRCYWEVEWSGLADIGVTYKGNSRKGDGSFCDFGYNNKSWRLACRGNHYIALHNNEYTTIPAPHLINPPQPQGDLSSSPSHLINPPQPQGDLSSSAPHLINPPQPQGDLSSSTPHLINPPQPQGDLSSSPPHLINPPQPQGDLSSSPPHLINPPQPQGDLSSSAPHFINPPQPQGDLSSSPPHLINPPQPQGDLSSSPPHLINPPQPQE
ncbi:extensin-like [Salvelinus namaycush]|uniref:Extensin-like n=1 Tax=Salvelinus namaycush TaxID=8040 RepID=A0A8U0PFA9_SALNM|nr:extensin-like [Salvelinus namaycush]